MAKEDWRSCCQSWTARPSRLASGPSWGCWRRWLSCSRRLPRAEEVERQRPVDAHGRRDRPGLLDHEDVAGGGDAAVGRAGDPDAAADLHGRQLRIALEPVAQGEGTGREVLPQRSEVDVHLVLVALLGKTASIPRRPSTCACQVDGRSWAWPEMTARKADSSPKTTRFTEVAIRALPTATAERHHSPGAPRRVAQRKENIIFRACRTPISRAAAICG